MILAASWVGVGLQERLGLILGMSPAAAELFWGKMVLSFPVSEELNLSRLVLILAALKAAQRLWG